MENIGENIPPFVDKGDGFPTPESVQEALEMFNLGVLAEVRINHMGQEGTTVELISQCRIKHLVSNWPKDFIAQVSVAVKLANQKSGAE
jgi:hypothetical protein